MKLAWHLSFLMVKDYNTVNLQVVQNEHVLKVKHFLVIQFYLVMISNNVGALPLPLFYIVGFCIYRIREWYWNIKWLSNIFLHYGSFSHSQPVTYFICVNILSRFIVHKDNISISFWDCKYVTHPTRIMLKDKRIGTTLLYECLQNSNYILG